MVGLAFEYVDKIEDANLLESGVDSDFYLELRIFYLGTVLARSC